MAGARALVAACCWWWLSLAAATELDLLGALSLRNTSRAGVSVAPGAQPQRPAYTLQGEFRSLQVEGAAFERAAELMRSSPEFTLLASLRQERANSGTIVSFSHGYNRYLELQSSGRRDEIRLHYVAAGSAGGEARVETFPYRLADGEWHRLALSVSGTQAQLLVDCHPLYRRLIQPPDRNFTQPQLSLWIGQRNIKHSMFKGTLQDVRLVSGPHGYLAQCPGLDSECPTCGQFALLQATVQELTQHIHDLSIKVLATEQRMGRLEECDCQKSCYANGSVHADGASWQNDCNRCACVHGEIICRPVECDRADCKSPILYPGECCPTCLKQCLLKGTLYEHGDRFTPKECAECVCHDGNMQCKRVDPETACQPLPCDPSEQFSVPGECCKFCPGVDYCSMGHSCDENATCMNLNTKYTCKCNQGFQGDGITCEDVNECLSAGGLHGHHCHSNTRCVNVLGGYICQCLAGYARTDKFNCAEVDECASGAHTCHVHADCANTLGSYECRCRPGYLGDGYSCTPECEGGCLNGGTCVAPDACACDGGFTGARCERDVDECAAAAAWGDAGGAGGTGERCPPGAACVNMPGWYYCRCRPGYRSQDSTHCIDVDECAEGVHTCHPTAECRNTEGSFQCHCDTPDCQLSCAWEGEGGGGAVADGARWAEAGGCRRCACAAGVVSCAPAPCACDAPAANASSPLTAAAAAPAAAAPAACCPHCDDAYTCRHQELHHVTFRSGERWLYQCQTCECLLGEVDCWEPECAEGAAAGAAGAAEVGAGAVGAAGSTPGGCALLQRCGGCQVGHCATLVSNIACCVHRARSGARGGSAALAAALTALLVGWWRRGAAGEGAGAVPHRKHRGCRPARARPEPARQPAAAAPSASTCLNIASTIHLNPA